MTETEKRALINLLKKAQGCIAGITAALKDDEKFNQARQLDTVTEILAETMMVIDSNIHVERVNWVKEKPADKDKAKDELEEMFGGMPL